MTAVGVLVDEKSAMMIQAHSLDRNADNVDDNIG
jgi:hypothetical protein